MDIKELEKKFEDANKNTLQILEKVIVFKSHMVDEINFVAKQAVESAKTEILLSELAGISDCKLSKLAQQLKSNPALEYMSGYDMIQKQALGGTSDKDWSNEDSNEFGNGGFGGSAGSNGGNGGNGGGIEIFDPPKGGKPHSQSRRTWLVMQTIPMDECELRIEVTRLKQSGGKKSSAKKEQVEEFEL